MARERNSELKTLIQCGQNTISNLKTIGLFLHKDKLNILTFYLHWISFKIIDRIHSTLSSDSFILKLSPL